MISAGIRKLWLGLFVLLLIAMFRCATYQQASKIDTEVARIEQKLDAMFEKKGSVTKEEAIAIAMMFARLKEVTAVHQPQVIGRHTQTFNVMGNDGKGDVLIGVDPSTGEVIKLVKQCPYPGRDAENVVISGEEAIQQSRQFLSEHGLRPIPESYIMEKPRLITTWNKKHWEILWRHYVGGIEVMPDFVSLIVNAENGEIILYSKVHHEIVIPHQPKVGADTAMALARGWLGKGTLQYYSPDMEILSTTLKILYPNNYFEDLTYHWSNRQTLAWVVQFTEDEESAIDIWVDAFTGDLLGGEIYEKPVPELWGIPDQTSDITSYPGWEPALDMMQYNSNHTFLGDANETDIVNSIANGDYFILQTHGGTTLTSEYARINHTGTVDAQRLTPDEIPNNSLRYALMSFCHSAHDAIGQDFRDVFVDRGSDVFHGYVESMNPDHYERALLRYLAEGQYLNNAHWNAVADENPWFTIVFEYDAICYNRIKLAPLLVDVSAPSSVWRNATIMATVRNREDARYTTARRVKAELVLPPGFSIIAGANPQVTPALAWNHSWTAQWIVHAPFWTRGVSTFDVVVWSDNLGVEVDDYDNPYHKVDIEFGHLDIVISGYLELFKWWEFAALLYEQFPEPRQIMALRDTLERYDGADDVKQNPVPFVRNMINMAQLEIQFGNRFVGSSREAPDVVRSYQSAVETKMTYLNRLLKDGIDDVMEVLTRLSAMQMKINVTALESFGEK